MSETEYCGNITGSDDCNKSYVKGSFVNPPYNTYELLNPCKWNEQETICKPGDWDACQTPKNNSDFEISQVIFK